MVKRYLLLAVLALTVLTASGCETLKGVANGFTCIAKGIGDDIYNGFGFLQSSEDWIKKNLW